MHIHQHGECKSHDLHLAFPDLLPDAYKYTHDSWPLRNSDRSCPHVTPIYPVQCTSIMPSIPIITYYFLAFRASTSHRDPAAGSSQPRTNIPKPCWPAAPVRSGPARLPAHWQCPDGASRRFGPILPDRPGHALLPAPKHCLRAPTKILERIGGSQACLQVRAGAGLQSST